MERYCENHTALFDKVFDRLEKTFNKVCVIEEKVINTDKRVNGSIDDIHDHIKNGSKWRLAIIGVSATIVINIFIAVYWYGRLSERVDILHSVVIKNAEAKTK